MFHSTLNTLQTRTDVRFENKLYPPFDAKKWGITSDKDHYLSCDTSNEIRVPIGNHPGAFGVVRRNHTHEGVDLYVPEGETVRAMEPGRVVAILPFTGPKVGSPWWQDTMAVMVEGKSGVVNYGEIEPEAALNIGDAVGVGDVLGRVVTVLAKDKGRPRSMLHLELYEHGTRSVVEWGVNEPQPPLLKDPTQLLLNAIGLQGLVHQVSTRESGAPIWHRQDDWDVQRRLTRTLSSALTEVEGTPWGAKVSSRRCGIHDETATVEKKAVLLVPFLICEGAAYLMITRRNCTHLLSPGEFVFPGGGMNEGESAVQAALRETYEEVGIRFTESEILGSLPPLQRKLEQNYEITPVIALKVVDQLRTVHDLKEVDSVVFLPFADWLCKSSTYGPLFPIEYGVPTNSESQSLAPSSAYALDLIQFGFTGHYHGYEYSNLQKD